MGKVLGAIYPLRSTRSGAGNRAFFLCFVCCVFFLPGIAGRISSGTILYKCSLCVTRKESSPTQMVNYTKCYSRLPGTSVGLVY